MTGLSNYGSFGLDKPGAGSGSTGCRQPQALHCARITRAPDAPSVVAGDGTLTASWTAPDQTGSGDITGYDLDAVVKGEAWNDEPRLTGLTGTAAEIGDLANGTEYALRVRAVNAIGAGAWSEAAHGTPSAPSLVRPFDDLALAHGAARSLDMAEHFTGDGLTFGVMVTTTHKRTGKVKTGPINTVARNKVRGVWSDDVLTLTAVPSGRHVLTLASLPPMAMARRRATASR